ncbi:MAG: nucleotidyltransferase domain-containing protein [Candidatus Lokiarchaeota archaeon]|nr:nucleotidyltransferase domain-containing protein [Candidatus Lokiarchaeota archaeon]
MNEFNFLNNVKKDLKKIDNFWVVIYGSSLSEYYIPLKSDIDIAIITQIKEKKENITIWKDIMGEFAEKYDIKIFELLPLFIKIEIIENYRVIFGNPLEISEYFYHYRSIWKDMVHRIESNRFKSIKEKIELLERKQF